MKKPFPMEPGRVVLSLAGRDANRYLLVLHVLDETYVQVVDGDLRPLIKPKKKKIRHLRAMPEVLLGHEVTRTDTQDAQIRMALSAYVDALGINKQKEG